MTTITERVAKGAAFLDQHEPGWWQRIELDKLDMRAPCQCVLGQLATDLEDDNWHIICRHFNVAPHSAADLSDYALGFNGHPAPWNAEHDPTDEEAEAVDAEYTALQAEWKRVIEARRAVTP